MNRDILQVAAISAVSIALAAVLCRIVHWIPDWVIYGVTGGILAVALAATVLLMVVINRIERWNRGAQQRSKWQSVQ
jgi:uncharacterized membrane protein